MGFLKSAIITVTLLTIALLGYMFVKFDSGYELNHVQEEFLKENYTEARKRLNTLKPSLQEKDYYLYLAYLNRAEGNLPETMSNLEQVSFLTTHHRPTPFLLETHLLGCLTAYEMNDRGAFFSSLDRIKKEFPNDPWVKMFVGLEHYIKGEYENAGNVWINNTALRVPLSPWMRRTFKEGMSQEWEKMLLARCQVEMGDYLDGRQTLEVISKSAEEHLIPEINFYLGLSYLNEAKTKTTATATPYYKLAFNYFNRSFIHNKEHKKEKEMIVGSIREVNTHLFTNQQYQDVAFFAGVLKNWEATDALQSLSKSVIQQLDKEIKNKDIQKSRLLASILNQIVTHPQEREKLSQTFFATVKTELNAGKIEVIRSYWDLTQIFTRDIKPMARQIHEVSRKKALDELMEDSQDLSKSTAYISLWNSIETDPAQKLKFAKDMVIMTTHLWLDDQGAKALQVCKLALQIPQKGDQDALKTYIGTTFNKVYVQAISDRKIDQLPFLLESAYSLNIKNINFKDQQSISRHLTEAERLYKDKRFEAAAKRVNWLIHLDSTNTQARRMAAIIAYAEGQYREAFYQFKQLDSVPQDLEEATLLSQYISSRGKSGVREIEERLEKNTLSQEGILRLAVNALIKNKGEEAIRWLEKADKENNEVIACLCLAYYELKEWKKATSSFHKLNRTYRDIDAMQAVYVLSLAQLGEDERAEKLLIELLQEPDEDIKITTLSPPFEILKRNRLEAFNRYFAAGKFYRDAKGESGQALEYFEKVEKPSEQQRIARAQIMIQMDKLEEAKVDLEAALHTGFTPNHLAKKVSLNLAEVYTNLGQYPEAVVIYKKYLRLVPLDLETLTKYAHVLMKVNLYDEALKQFLKLRKNEDFTSFDDRIAYLECLVRTNHQDEAIEQTYIWLSDNPPPEMSEQLKLAKIMVSIEASQLVFPILEQISQAEEVSLVEQVGLIDLLNQLGAFEKAEEIADQIQQQLEQSEKGLMLLSSIKESLSKREEAIKFATLALKKNPYNVNATNLVDRNQDELESVVALARELRKKIKKDQSVPSNKLLYARRLDIVAARTSEEKGELPPRLIGELKDAYYMLEKMEGRGYRFPEVYYLMGQMMYHIGALDMAFTAFEQAVELDSSFSAAHRSIALIKKEKTTDKTKSIDMLETASKYSPNDFDTWFLLAHFYLLSDDYFEAKKALLKAIKYQPNNPKPYLHLGKLLRELKNPEDAWAAFEKAVELDPENIDALKSLLTCLYDKSLRIDRDNARKLRSQKNETFKRLHELDPKQAEELLISLIKPKEDEADIQMMEELVK